MVPASERHVFKFTDFFTDNELELLKASGEKLIDNVGIDVIRGVVYDVLTGRNLRDSTEVLTRRRVDTGFCSGGL